VNIAYLEHSDGVGALWQNLYGLLANYIKLSLDNYCPDSKPNKNRCNQKAN
jgi:hypothetical protein